MTKAFVCQRLFAALSLAVSGVASADVVTDYDVISAAAMPARYAAQAALSEITNAGTRTVAVGDYGVILYRDADSREWQQAAVDSSVFLTAVSFADAQHGWAVGHHGVILHSADGGQSWQRQLDGFQLTQLQVDAFSATLAALETELADASDDEQAMLLEERIGSVSFMLETAQLALEEGPTRPFLDVLALDAHTVIAVGAYGTAVRTTDGGQSWQVLDAKLDNPNEFHLNAMAGDQQALYLAGEQGLMFKSDDAGASFTAIEPPYEGSYFGLLVDHQQRLWAFGLRGNVFVSDDGGANFTAISLNKRVNINAAVDAAEGGVYLVGNAGMVAHIDAQLQATEVDHPSGATLTDVVLDSAGQLTLVGQRGVLQMPALIPVSTQGQ